MVEYGAKTISFTSMGEVMLLPDFFKLATYAHSKGLNINLITNGSVLSKHNCNLLKSAGITFVNISLNALSYEVHQDICSSKFNQFKVATSAPFYLQELGIKTQVSFVEQEENQHELDAFINFWKSTNIDSIQILKKIFIDNNKQLSFFPMKILKVMFLVSLAVKVLVNLQLSTLMEQF